VAIEINRRDLGAVDLRLASARTHDANQARRLLAIALVMEGTCRTDAARICGMDRQTLRDWVHRYNEDGVDGLVDRARSGRKRTLTAEQEADFAELVSKGPDISEDGVVRWRRVDLRDVIEERYGVGLHERSVGKLLHRLGFGHMSVRPSHPKADLEARAAFKKTLPHW
jgi:putative transposase